jgi:hypothetical protein
VRLGRLAERWAHPEVAEDTPGNTHELPGKSVRSQSRLFIRWIDDFPAIFLALRAQPPPFQGREANRRWNLECIAAVR